MILLLPFTSTPSTPPLGPVATCACDGADPVAPASAPTLPRGVLPFDLVTVDGRAGQFQVREVCGDVCEVVAGGSFYSVPLGAVRRV